MRLRDAISDHIDQPANRTGAIQKRRWPAQNLDLARAEYFGGHRVIGADGGDVERANAVLSGLDARPVDAFVWLRCDWRAG